LDPNRDISGKGERALTAAGIDTELYPLEFKNQILQLNREFIRAHAESGIDTTLPQEFIDARAGRSLDEWYEAVNRIYWNRQFHHTPSDVYTHLAEVTLALSVVAGDRVKPKIDPDRFLVKAISWWMSLCGKLSVRSVSDLVWRKFPGVCPYCKVQPHDGLRCGELKQKGEALDWDALAELGKKNQKPVTLGDWQHMFARIYPPSFPLPVIFGRLAEEMGELSESIRIFPQQPGYFLSEAPDVFAWLMHMQNTFEQKGGVPSAKWGQSLQAKFCKTYPDSCTFCEQYPCACPPIVQSTIGRIAKEVPIGRGAYGDYGVFMTPEGKEYRFNPSRQKPTSS